MAKATKTRRIRSFIGYVFQRSSLLLFLGFFYEIKLPFSVSGVHLNLAIIALVLVVAYYFSLSKTLWIGMLVFVVACLLLCHLIELSKFLPLWLCCIIIFVLAWIGQFYGHKVEGKKPSFLKDLHFLLIGPAWLMSFIYKKIGIRL